MTTESSKGIYRGIDGVGERGDCDSDIFEGLTIT
jgi:hypothetical protein